MVNIKNTLEERGTRYGEFIDNATIAQKIKSIYRESPNWGSMPADQQEALDQIASKISRHLVGDFMYDDGFRDIAGYATLAVERLEKLSNKTSEVKSNEYIVAEKTHRRFMVDTDFSGTIKDIVGEVTLTEESCKLIEASNGALALVMSLIDNDDGVKIAGVSLVHDYRYKF